MDTSKEFLEHLGKLITETINTKMKELEKEITDEIRNKLTHETKAILTNNHISLIRTSFEKPEVKQKEETGQLKKDNKEKASKEIEKYEYFFLKDGTAIKSIQELYGALESMDDEVYYWHVTDYKNDFADWIAHTLGEKRLAEKIRLLRYRAGVTEEIKKWLYANVSKSI